MHAALLCHNNLDLCEGAVSRSMNYDQFNLDQVMGAVGKFTNQKGREAKKTLPFPKPPPNNGQSCTDNSTGQSKSGNQKLFYIFIQSTAFFEHRPINQIQIAL